MLTSTHIDLNPLSRQATRPTAVDVDPSGAHLAANVREALRLAAYVHEDEVLVEVRDHAVYLSGTVKWAHQRVAAARAVENLPGVHVLSSRIRVAPRVSAAEAKSNILAALGEKAAGHRLDVAVDDESVTLTGAVSSYSDRQIAEQAARSMPHARTVNNELTVVRC